MSAGVITIVRSVEIGDEGDAEADPLDEIVAAIYPTLAYIEDQTQSRPEKLFIAGFRQRSGPPPRGRTRHPGRTD